MTFGLSLILAAILSSNSTVWMRPESFHLSIGMSRAAVEKQLALDAWKAKPGDDARHLVIDYTDTKAVTLEFEKERLRSIRFELFAMIPEARSAFEEEKSYLKGTFGSARPVRSPLIVIYDNQLPNVMVVLTDDRNSEKGKTGLGMVVVRYYDPAAK